MATRQHSFHWLPPCYRTIQPILLAKTIDQDIQGITMSNPIERCPVMINQVAGAVFGINRTPNLKPAMLVRSCYIECSFRRKAGPSNIPNTKLVAPFTLLGRRESQTPGCFPIPKTRYLYLSSIGCSKGTIQGDFTDIIRIGIRCRNLHSKFNHYSGGLQFGPVLPI